MSQITNAAMDPASANDATIRVTPRSVLCQRAFSARPQCVGGWSLFIMSWGYVGDQLLLLGMLQRRRFNPL